MTAASMESCRFAARRSPRGRFWSVVDVRKRLQRVRHPFHQSIHIKQGAQPANQLEPKSSKFWIQSSLESPKHRRMRPRGPPDPRPIPQGVREPIYIRKKCAIWTRWRLIPVKNVNYPRLPSSRRSGLVGPYTTPPIVNYKYMSSTRREGYFELPTLGS